MQKLASEEEKEGRAMPDKEVDAREQLKAALGAIPEGAIVDRGEILIQWPIAISSITDSTTTIQNLLLGKRCVRSRMLDVSGGGVTDANGKATIRLKDVTCLFAPPQAGENFLVASAPINVVATPRAQSAIHATVRASLVNADRDAQIEVFTWDAQGQPVGGAPFYWRCTVALEENVG
ncbi:hypothetical protein [Agromyces sp. NPDC055661]